MEQFFLQNESFFIIPSLLKKGVTLGFSTKNGGVSKPPFASNNLGFHVQDHENDVLTNRNKLGELLSFPIDSWVGAIQTHENYIRIVEGKDKGLGSKQYEDGFTRTDGFFTREKGILLTLCFADCVPLYFINKNYDAIGIAHAGWRGTVALIGEEMVKIFQREQIPLEDILVVIGPAICENCYIVDNRLITIIDNKIPYQDDCYQKLQGNEYRLNLKKLNKQILLNAGILEENIYISNLCTSCHKEQFFSHRRDGGKTGRMLGFIGLKED